MKFQSLKITHLNKNFTFKIVKFFKLEKKNHYCFYEFVFAFNNFKYYNFQQILRNRIDFLKSFQLNFNKKINFKKIKNCYISFLHKKKCFTDYICEFYFLKLFSFKDFLKIVLIGNQTESKNVEFLKNFNVSKLMTSQNFLIYPFTNIFLKTSLRKMKPEKILEIFPKGFIRSHTLKLYFKELDFLNKKISLKLFNFNSLNRKINKTKQCYKNLDFILNYYSELQNEIDKLSYYFEFQKRKNLEFLFFKFRNFQLKHITKMFQLKFFEMYLTSLDKINNKTLKILNLKKFRQTTLEMSETKLVNSGIKSILLNLEFLFSTNFLYKTSAFRIFQSFYDNRLITYLVKESKIPTFAFIEFLKQITGKINFFSNKRQNLFVLNSQEQKYFFNSQDDFSLIVIKFLIAESGLIYTNFQILRNSNPFNFIKFEFRSFLTSTKSLTNFESLFLKMVINKQFNLFTPVSKHFETEIIEIYLFNKLFQMNFFLLKNLKIKNLLNYSTLIAVDIRPLWIKYNSMTFFQMRKKKKSDIVKSLKFFYLYTLNTSLKNVRFYSLYCYYSNKLVYLEKTNSQFLILVNQNTKLVKTLNLIKKIKLWFISFSNFFNLETNLYVYDLKLDSSVSRFQFNERTFEKNYQKKFIYSTSNKFMFIYGNFLVIPLTFKKIIELPIKCNQEVYLISLKKIFKDYSNKKQTFLIKILSEKIYVWVYFYRFLLLKAYFLQLDQKLFELLLKWSIRRHNNKSKNWIKTKYFFQLNKKNLIFGIYTSQSCKKLSQSPSFIYLPFYAQLFLHFKF